MKETVRVCPQYLKETDKEGWLSGNDSDARLEELLKQLNRKTDYGPFPATCQFIFLTRT
jgi:hypothetical protein